MTNSAQTRSHQGLIRIHDAVGQNMGHSEIQYRQSLDISRGVKRGEIREGDIVLISTGGDKQIEDQKYFIEHPFLSEPFARFLAEKRISCLGIDAPSPDSPNSTDFPTHRILLGVGIPIIEGLTNLHEIPAGKTVWFAAMPLKIRGGEASPVRAVAILSEDEAELPKLKFPK